MDSDVKRLADERRKKVIANAEARLKKITDLARAQNPKPPENNFVDFEVDSFVNEPYKVAGHASEDAPLIANHLPLAAEDASAPINRLASEANGRVHDAFSRTSTQSTNHLAESERYVDFIRLLQSRSVAPDIYAGQAQRGPQLPNGLPFNQNSQQNFNNLDIGNLMAAMSSLTAAMQPPGAAPAQQEQLQPVAKPYLVIATFLILGVVARLILQFSSYNFNVIIPFLCLAVPLGLMSWGRRRPPVTGLLSTLFLFLRNPQTQAMIIYWIRLTSLFRGLCQLFACYLFSFVMAHVLLEVPSLYSDIASTPA